jgi:hypothetical protein
MDQKFDFESQKTLPWILKNWKRKFTTKDVKPSTQDCLYHDWVYVSNDKAFFSHQHKIYHDYVSK